MWSQHECRFHLEGKNDYYDNVFPWETQDETTKRNGIIFSSGKQSNRRWGQTALYNCITFWLYFISCYVISLSSCFLLIINNQQHYYHPQSLCFSIKNYGLLSYNKPCKVRLFPVSNQLQSKDETQENTAFLVRRALN